MSFHTDAISQFPPRTWRPLRLHLRNKTQSTQRHRGGSGKTNGGRKSTTVAVEGTENATVNAEEARRFFGELSIILRPCKMMDANFAKYKTSHITSFVPSVAQAFIRGDFPHHTM